MKGYKSTVPSSHFWSVTRIEVSCVMGWKGNSVYHVINNSYLLKVSGQEAVEGILDGSEKCTPHTEGTQVLLTFNDWLAKCGSCHNAVHES